MQAMKISLKSKGIDLEIDSVEKLDEVLDFVQKFKELEVQTEAAKLKLERQAQMKIAQAGRKKRAK